MHRFIIAIASLALAAGLLATAGELGAIKRFKAFPIDTYDQFGNYSDTQLLANTTPSPDRISVDGWWPDKKMLLITIGDESYFILFSAVEMNDQADWDRKMAATGGVQCNYKKVVGGSKNQSVGGSKASGTKGFASPC